MVPQKSCLKHEIYTRQTRNKQAGIISTTHEKKTTNTLKRSGMEERQASSEKRRRHEREELLHNRSLQKQNKKKKWEKRLNENYFKLFRRRNWSRAETKQASEESRTFPFWENAAKQKWRVTAAAAILHRSQDLWEGTKRRIGQGQNADSCQPLFQIVCAALLARNVRLWFVFLSKPRSKSVEKQNGTLKVKESKIMQYSIIIFNIFVYVLKKNSKQNM